MANRDRLLSGLTLAVVDVETTGLSPSRGHRVCEIAVVRYASGHPTATFQQLVDPQRPMDPGAFAVHGITDQMLAGAPPFPAIASQVLELTRDAILVGHNVWFDTRFLAAELGRAGLSLAPNACLDTLDLARAILELPHYNLSTVSSALGVRVRGRAHRAMADALMTWGVLGRLLDLLDDDEIEGLEDLFQFQRARSYTATNERFDIPVAIQRVLAEGLMLHIRYTDAAGRATERIVHPLRVVPGAEAPALEAYCYLRQQIRHFRLDRIVSYDLVEGET
ncbi:MAG: exonuclease domain-containing protein [Anaerolineae bacterium]